MKKEEWNEGMNHLDSDLVEEYVSKKEQLTQKNKMPKGFWLRVGAVAACLVLIIGAGVALGESGLLSPPIIVDPTEPTRPQAPIWDGAIYSAAEMAKLFNQQTAGVETTHYTTVTVSDPEKLYLPPILDVEYLDVYRRVEERFEADEAELRTFFDGYLPKVANSLGLEGMAIPSYNTYIMPIGKDDRYINYVNASVKMDGYRMECRQDDLKTEFSLTNAYDENRKSIYLDGKQVRINNNQSDEAMLASLESVKNTLFDIFGVSFPDAKIVRGSEPGSWYTTIYFYDKSAEPFDFAIDDLKERTPVTDRIKISFSYMGTYITYTQMRGDLEGEYECFARAKIISLEEAEELLYKEYVFGGHFCPACMGQQTGVDFEGYDFVGMEYLFGYDSAIVQQTPLMPFYVFYKKIGEEDGKLIYAKTYVSAVEVSGYESYFKS